MNVYLLNFGEDVTDIENKIPLKIYSASEMTELPKRLRFLGGRRISYYERIEGITVKGLPIYKETDEEVKQP